MRGACYNNRNGGLNMIEIINVEKKGYGYEIDKPIKAMSAVGSYAYLNELKSIFGIMVKWERKGSFSTENSNKLIDKYFVYVLKTDEAKLLRYTLYIDMYHRWNDETKPEDFE